MEHAARARTIDYVDVSQEFPRLELANVRISASQPEKDGGARVNIRYGRKKAPPKRNGEPKLRDKHGKQNQSTKYRSEPAWSRKVKSGQKLAPNPYHDAADLTPT